MFRRAVRSVSGACAVVAAFDTVEMVSSAESNVLVSEEFFDGPWRSAFWVRVPFPIRSKSNFRRYSVSSHKSDWQEFQAFERGVAVSVQSVLPGSWCQLEPAVRLADRPVVASFVAAKSRLDSANFSKSVLDACEGLLFVSDASVLATGSVSVRGVGLCFALGFAQLDPGSGPEAVHAAQVELSSRVLASFSFV